MEEKTFRESSVRLIVNIIIDSLLMLVVIGFVLLPLHILQYLKTSLTLTRTGIILRKGILTVHATEIPYAKINSVSVRRGVLGNIFGYGDIVILVGNDTGGIPFGGIESPDSLKEEIMKYIHSYSPSNTNHSDQQLSKESTTSEPKDAYNELEKLAQLKEKRIITAEEFEIKKKQILNIS